MSDYFPGMRKPSTDVAAVASQLQTVPLYVDVDLTNARSLAANTQLDLPISGNVIYIDQQSSTGSAQVIFQDRGAVRPTPITAFPGFIARVPFTSLRIVNQAQAGATLRIVYGWDLDFVPAIGAGVFGTLSVIDGSVTRSAAGVTFYGWGFQGGAAAQFSLVQLWNDPASGKNIILNQISAHVSAATAVYLYESAAIMPASQVPRTKKLPTVASIGSSVRAQTAAALAGTQLAFVSFSAGADTKVFPLSNPMIIPPGSGMHVAAITANIALGVTFEFYEETAT